VEKYLPEIITIAAGIFTWAVTLGIFKNKVESNDSVVKSSVEEVRNLRINFAVMEQKISTHEAKIKANEEKHEALRDLLDELKSDVRMIAAWVQEKKQEEK
jgi:hypothetical protein